MVRDVADFIRGTENALLFNHSRRVFWRGALHGHRLGLRPDLELLYSAAMFNDIGLTDLYRDSYIRFEIDGANAARDFVLQHGIDESDARKIWLGVPLHTTPGVPEFLEPEIALITAGVETDNMAIGRDELLRRKYGAREGDRSRVSIHLPEAEDVHGGGLSFKGMESSLDESGRSRCQGVDALLGEKDGVAGGFGELLDAGRDVDGVTDEGELELAAAADGSSDHHAGVDSDTDAKLPTEPLGNQTMNQLSGPHSGVGMIGKIVGCTEDSQCSVAEKFVHMATGIDDGRHDDLEQSVKPGDGFFGGVGLGEWSEVADVDEHHGHLAALAGEHVVALLKQSRSQGRVDIGPERRVKSLPLS